MSTGVQEECSARAGHCVLLNIHAAVKGYRLTQVEILCGYCEETHPTMLRPLTHADIQTWLLTHKLAHTEVFKNEVKKSVLN